MWFIKYKFSSIIVLLIVEIVVLVFLVGCRLVFFFREQWSE